MAFPLSIRALSPAYLHGRRIALRRCHDLFGYEADQSRGDADKPSTVSAESTVGVLGAALSRCGVTSSRQRARCQLLFIAVLVATIGSALAATASRGVVAAVFGAGVGIYLGVAVCAIVLRSWQRDYERQILYFTPLALESLILLVQSGVGILPALHHVVSAREQTSYVDPVTRALRLVYDLCDHGTPLSEALATVAERSPSSVLRHVLLHLDIAGNEGGELIPSLQALSGYAHTQWKLSVEARVRRLENLVVFPVFLAVIGLLLLVASVPLVPILDLKHTLPANSTFAGSSSSVVPALTKQPTGRSAP